MNFTKLASAVSAEIKLNGNNEITGQKLQDVLLRIISDIGADRQFAGVATKDTIPAETDGNVFYLSSGAGDYASFHLTIPDGLCVIVNNASGWTFTELVSKAKELIMIQSVTDEDDKVPSCYAVNNFVADKLKDYKNNTELQKELDKKVNAEAGKGLSSNDFTQAEKDKLANISDEIHFVEGSDYNSLLWNIVNGEKGLYRYKITDPESGETSEGHCFYGGYDAPNGDYIKMIWRFDSYYNTIYYREIKNVGGNVTDSGNVKYPSSEIKTVEGSDYSGLFWNIINGEKGLYKYKITDAETSETAEGNCLYCGYENPNGDYIRTVFRFDSSNSITYREIKNTGGIITDSGNKKYPFDKVNTSDMSDDLRYLHIEKVGRIIPFMGFAPTTGATYDYTTPIETPAKDLFARLYFRETGNKGFYYLADDGKYYSQFTQKEMFDGNNYDMFLNEFVLVTANGAPNMSYVNAAGSPLRYVWCLDEKLVPIN